jgi:hypothetical protein
MKIDEVMLGDIVSVSGRPIHVTLAVLNHWSDNIRPIPLTKEILEKNADSHFDERVYDIYCFHNEDDDGYAHLVEITFIYGQFEWTINSNEYGIAEIKYVHELQHALRLCKVDKEIVL